MVLPRGDRRGRGQALPPGQRRPHPYLKKPHEARRGYRNEHATIRTQRKPLPDTPGSALHGWTRDKTAEGQRVRPHLLNSFKRVGQPAPATMALGQTSRGSSARQTAWKGTPWWELGDLGLGLGLQPLLFTRFPRPRPEKSRPPRASSKLEFQPDYAWGRPPRAGDPGSPRRLGQGKAAARRSSRPRCPPWPGSSPDGGPCLGLRCSARPPRKTGITPSAVPPRIDLGNKLSTDRLGRPGSFSFDAAAAADMRQHLRTSP